METVYPRYPGAQPFSDDDIARAVFFGRGREAAALTDQILGNRLVVLYAKSGLGKSSLLNAGVAWRLREANCLPLIVRVNDTKSGAFASVYDGIRRAAERQNVEYHPGDLSSLWDFFETSEFWHGDILLKPVLIIDQFEELFTLQGIQHRTDFITGLGFLLRGVRPPASQQRASDLSTAPPPISVVLSLREDYLGLLEEAADSIPQILNCRFRLTPLSVAAASEAMIKPAGIENPAFQTRTFRYEQGATTAILKFLSRQDTESALGKPPQVEPFHLQLICRRVEEIVTARQTQGARDAEVTLEDLGGVGNLSRILRDFYQQEIGRIPKRRIRKAARRLCEDHLISPEGQRLSLAEAEIRRLLRIPADALQELVDRRLLRRDLRADSIYYELGHDSLMKAVLSYGRMKRRIGGMAKIIASLFFFLFLSLMVLSLVVTTMEPKSDVLIVLIFFAFPILIACFWFARFLFRDGSDTMRRYRRRE